MSKKCIAYGSLPLHEYGTIMTIDQPYAGIESSLTDMGRLGQLATGVSLQNPEIEVTVLLPFADGTLRYFMHTYFDILMYPTLNDTWWRFQTGEFVDGDEVFDDFWRLARLKEAPEFHEYVNCTVMRMVFIAKEPWMYRDDTTLNVADGATGTVWLYASSAIETPVMISGTLSGEYTSGSNSRPVEFEILEGTVVKHKLGLETGSAGFTNAVVIDSENRQCLLNGNQKPLGDEYDWVYLKGGRRYSFRMSKGSGAFTVTMRGRWL